MPDKNPKREVAPRRLAIYQARGSVLGMRWRGRTGPDFGKWPHSGMVKARDPLARPAASGIASSRFCAYAEF